MFKVNIIVEDSKWKKEIPTIEKMLKKKCKKNLLFYYQNQGKKKFRNIGTIN